MDQEGANQATPIAAMGAPPGGAMGAAPGGAMGAAPGGAMGAAPAAAANVAGGNANQGGLWSPAMEACLREALLLYPPRGRRKFFVMEEGQLFGRNQMIAKHILLRTGQQRTRKQISSHIQVLALKRVHNAARTLRFRQAARDAQLARFRRMSSAQIVQEIAMRGAPAVVAPPAANIHGIGHGYGYY